MLCRASPHALTSRSADRNRFGIDAPTVSTTLVFRRMFRYDPLMLRIPATVLLAVSLLLPGCAWWFMRGEPPEVLVTNVTPLEASAFEQRLKVDLRLRNPNDFDLKVTGVDFHLDLNGNPLARGLGNQEVLVPRLGETVASVTTSTSTLDVFRQFMAFSPDRPVTYTIKGVLHTSDGRLPFENSGVLLEKSRPSDAPAAQ